MYSSANPPSYREENRRVGDNYWNASRVYPSLNKPDTNRISIESLSAAHKFPSSNFVASSNVDNRRNYFDQDIKSSLSNPYIRPGDSKYLDNIPKTNTVFDSNLGKGSKFESPYVNYGSPEYKPYQSHSNYQPTNSPSHDIRIRDIENEYQRNKLKLDDDMKELKKSRDFLQDTLNFLENVYRNN